LYENFLNHFLLWVWVCNATAVVVSYYCAEECVVVENSFQLIGLD